MAGRCSIKSPDENGIEIVSLPDTNIGNYEEKETLNFSQMEEYATSKLSKGKYELWKTKLEMKKNIQRFHNSVLKKI